MSSLPRAGHLARRSQRDGVHVEPGQPTRREAHVDVVVRGPVAGVVENDRDDLAGKARFELRDGFRPRRE
jgi:hypothetical protein